MTYDEFLRRLGKAGLSVREFAELVGMNRNSVSNYARREEVPAHLAVIAALMGEMAEHRLDFRAVLEPIDLKLKKPRGRSRPGRFGGDRQNDLDFGP
jgi:transcriptional regulator with XRE-family HTH domain